MVWGRCLFLSDFPCSHCSYSDNFRSSVTNKGTTAAGPSLLSEVWEVPKECLTPGHPKGYGSMCSDTGSLLSQDAKILSMWAEKSTV